MTRAGHTRLLERIPANTLVAIGVLLSLVVLSLFALADEIEISRWSSALQRQQLALQRGSDSPEPYDAASTQNPRVRIQSGLFYARAASAAPNEAKARENLVAAEQDMAVVRSSHLRLGEADIVRAYIASLQEGHKSQLSLALNESYRNAPYLRESALWRVPVAVESWAGLSEPTRRKLIDEAVWIARMHPEQRGQIFDTMRTSPAYESFMLRWYETRSGDADWQGTKAIQP